MEDPAINEDSDIEEAKDDHMSKFTTMLPRFKRKQKKNPIILQSIWTRR